MKKLLFILLFLPLICQAQISVVRRSYTTTVAEYHSTLLDGLLGYYKCDETSGTNVADARGVYNGTVSVYGQIVRDAAGKNNYSLNYNGNGGAVNIPNAMLSGKVTDKVNISLWFTLDTLSSTLGRNQFLFSACSAAGNQVVAIRMESDNGITVVTRDNAGVSKFTWTAALTTSATYRHLLVSIPGVGTAGKIYINGSDVTAGAEAQTNVFDTFNYADGICIGNAYDHGVYAWCGKIDESCFYNRLVDIDSLYNAGTGKFYPFNP